VTTKPPQTSMHCLPVCSGPLSCGPEGCIGTPNQRYRAIAAVKPPNPKVARGCEVQVAWDQAHSVLGDHDEFLEATSSSVLVIRAYFMCC